MKIAILDIDSIVFTIGHPNKQLNEHGEPMRTEDNSKWLYIDKTEEELISSCDSLMNSILSNGGFTHYIGYIKGSNTTINRLIVNPDYKGNRKTETPKWWLFVKNYLINKWGIITANGMEVDDAVNITRLKLTDSHIVGVDKDELNLEGTHYNWVKNQWVSVDKQQASIYFWTDMITGQSGDNIKGVPGIGKANVIFKEGLFKPTPEYVLSLYIHKFGEINGINEFYKNYRCLKILDRYDNFIIPEIIEYKKEGRDVSVVEEEKAEEW